MNTKFIPFLNRATLTKVAPFFLFCLHLQADEYQLKLRYAIESSKEKSSDVTIHQKSSTFLGMDQVASVGGSSRLEFIGPSGELLRVGHYSKFAPIAPNKLQFIQGSFLLHVHEGAPQYTIVIKGQEIKFAAHGTFLCELMKKGGLKVISLSGEGNIISMPSGAHDHVRPSYVQFFLNDGNNPPAIEIDLALAVNTCPLISLFRDQLPSHPEIEKLAIQQARNIKLRSNAYIYDALSKEQVRLLVPKGDKSNEAKQPSKPSRNPINWIRRGIGL